MQGILYAGKYHLVEGLEVTSPGPGAPSWQKLSRGDYSMRKTDWIRQLIFHTTKGIESTFVRPGAGVGGKDRTVADFWSKSEDHSAAQIIIDNDGSVAVLCDLATIAAYAATTSNDWSVNVELYQEPDGSVYTAVYRAWAKLAPALCSILRIPFQIHLAPYKRGAIVQRMKHGGPDCVGLFGHRDQAWKFPQHLSLEQRLKYPNGYANRGKGDPGDHAYQVVVVAGAETFDYSKSEDIASWRRRQMLLIAMGEKLTPNGICDHSTMDAMRRRGFSHGAAIYP